VGGENHKHVRFEKQKMTRGTRQKYQKGVVKVRVGSEPFNPQIARIHERIALLRARILKRNLQGQPGQNFIQRDWEWVDCQVYFNDPEENGSDAEKKNLFEAEYEWIGEGGSRTHDANDTKDLIISGPSFLSIAARNSNASGDSDSESEEEDQIPGELPEGLWLMDTGSGHDLTTPAGADGYDLEKIREIVFSTASGRISTYTAISVLGTLLRGPADPYALPETP
jgi:hypothetical protein